MNEKGFSQSNTSSIAVVEQGEIPTTIKTMGGTGSAKRTDHASRRERR